MTALLTAATLGGPASAGAADRTQLGRLATGATVWAVGGQRGIGLEVTGGGLADVRQPAPIQVAYDANPSTKDAVQQDLADVRSGYRRLRRTKDGFVGTGSVSPAPGVTVEVSDRWSIAGPVLRLVRSVAVHGSADGGFMSGIELDVAAPVTREKTDYFVPGTVYGSTDHIQSTPGTPFNDIGSAATYGPGYRGIMRIREDRLAAPLVGVRFEDGSSATLLDAAPAGGTTAADVGETGGTTLVDRRFRFGALGADQPGSKLTLGYAFPGSEGETSYPGGTAGVKGADSLHRWIRREHPLLDGLTQRYELAWRFGTREDWSAYHRAAWRWAWDELDPQIDAKPFATVRKSLLTQLASTIVTNHGTGIPVAWDPKSGKQLFHPDWLQGQGPQWSVIGFLGRALEAAGHLITASTTHPADFEDPGGVRGRAAAVIDTLATLPMNPPAAEGVDLSTGLPTNYPYPDGPIIHLRSLAEDFAGLVRTIEFERTQGRPHDDWLAWARDLGDFLLGQQGADGSFPRTWQPATGIPADTDKGATSFAVPFLLGLSRVTGDARYRAAALRAGAFAAKLAEHDQYWGGTADHSGSLDKEAASLSLRANLDLYDATHDGRWIEEARRAADFEETWVYLWNVPMPVDAPDASLTWDRDVSTVGLNLVATGGSGVDNFAANDAASFGRLYELTGDSHYLEVGRMLLNNSFNMLALPGRLHGLVAPGWSYEYWSLVMARGTSGTNDWMPWMGAAFLAGVLGAEQLQPATITAMTEGAGTTG